MDDEIVYISSEDDNEAHAGPTPAKKTRFVSYLSGSESDGESDTDSDGVTFLPSPRSQTGMNAASYSPSQQVTCKAAEAASQVAVGSPAFDESTNNNNSALCMLVEMLEREESVVTPKTPSPATVMSSTPVSSSVSSPAGSMVLSDEDAAGQGSCSSVNLGDMSSSSQVLLEEKKSCVSAASCSPESHHAPKTVPDTAGTKAHSESMLIAFCGEEAAFFDRRAGEVTSRAICQSHAEDPKSDFYGMGDSVRQAVFEVYHLVKLHPWQELVMGAEVAAKDGERNILIRAPTSGGKTLVAILLLLRTMILSKKDCMLVLPFVAIVSEKAQELKRLAALLSGFAVAEYASSKGVFPVPAQKSSLRSLYVCTPEKATALWKFLCADGSRRTEIGMIAVDECHMICDESRGAVVEELLVSLLHSSTAPVVALSATIGGVDSYSTFLGGGRREQCSLYDIHSRPTDISENMIVAGMVVPILRDREGKGSLQMSEARLDIMDEEKDKVFLESDLLKNDVHNAIVCKLALESMNKGDSVLVFCGTRKGCVFMCGLLTQAHQTIFPNDATCSDPIQIQRAHLRGHLESESSGRVSSVLLSGILVGIGFHSAELQPSERLAVEEAYKRGILSVLCCTTTLAAGVNLPACRVIITSPSLGSHFISCTQYMQIIGRCGRTGLIKKGSLAESFILVHPNESDKFQKLIEKHVEDLTSQLKNSSSYYVRGGTSHDDYSGVTRVLLNCLLKPIRLSDLLNVCRLTLLYQLGEKVLIEGHPSVVFTLLPFLKELMDLLNRGHIQVVESETLQTDVMYLKLENHSILEVSGSFKQKHLREEMVEPEVFNELPADTLNCFLRSLAVAMQQPKDAHEVYDYFLKLSPLAIASSSASISIRDAEKFVDDASALQKNMCLENPLPILFLAITECMSKPLILDPQYQDRVNSINAMAVNMMLVREFSSHPDAHFLTSIGLDGGRLLEWAMGNPVIRQDRSFNEKLTRAWSALFLKELLASPDNAEKLCNQYKFERSMVLDLTTMLASRLQNLKLCCQKLDRFWWFPPIAQKLARKLSTTCTDDVRPLLALDHVTVERAKCMLKIGLRTVHDVARIFPPKILAEKVPHLSKWEALEIYLSARRLVSEEAAYLEAESHERRQILH